MAENKAGLQKKVSSIFKDAPVSKAGDGKGPAIVPLLARTESQPPVQENKQEEEKNGMTVNLIRFRNNGEQKVFPLPSAVTVIGRRRNCDLQIPHNCVSKKHCQICLDDGTLKIRDLGSRNGTFLNGVRTDEALIQPGDWVQIGPIGFVFQINGQPEKVTAPAVKTVEAAKPKKEKVAAKAPAKTDAEHFDKLDSSDVSSIIDADAKDVLDASDASDILIDDSELLKNDTDIQLDDLN